MTGPLQKTHLSIFGLTCFLVCAISGPVPAQSVILHLKDGDKISGLIVSENTNQVVISNAWAKALRISVSDIAKRETQKITNAPPPASATAATKPSPAKAPSPAPKAATKPAAPAHAVAAAKPGPTPKPKPKPRPKGTWHGQISVGTSIIVGQRDQQDYSGNLHLVYALPYQGHPKKFFRNTFDVGGQYQRTDGQESANHVNGSDKSDFDLWKQFYAYGYVGAGYDDVRNIDFEYQLGPGAGAHLIHSSKVALDTEAGLTYRAQYNRDAPHLETFYARISEEFTWAIWKNVNLTEQDAFYPDFEHTGQYHNDFTAVLSYGFWKHLTLNLRVSDHYNTQLAPGVDPNEFNFRSSLGYSF